MVKTEICRMSAVDMAEAIRTRKLSPVELMDAVLARMEQLNPKVNAYCTPLAESAREQARLAEARVMKKEKLGPLHGVPISIKDLIFTKGVRTTGGSRLYENFIPEQDAIVVERLKAAGAIMTGKTNTSEFGWVAITDNLLFGPSHNPWNLDYNTGGSSGGAAASVALCMPPIGIGSDGGGSIRIPASFCGVFGFKPSYGRVPQYPGFMGWEHLSHTGPITRTVADAALLMEVIAGRDDRDRYTLPDTGTRYFPLAPMEMKGLRIAWSKDLGYALVDPEVLKITEAAAKTFARLGASVEEANPPIKSPEAAFSTLVGVSMATVLGDKLPQWGDKLGAAMVRFTERNLGKLATEYVGATLENLELWSGMMSFFSKYDLLLTPTLAVPPLEIGRFAVKEIAGQKATPLGWMAFTYPFNITGQPAASVPCGWTAKGLPVGLQIVGRRFDDVGVLRAAAAFEKAAPWLTRLPPLG